MKYVILRLSSPHGNFISIDFFQSGERNRRALGTALNVAVGLLEASYKVKSSTILLFLIKKIMDIHC